MEDDEQDEKQQEQNEADQSGAIEMQALKKKKFFPKHELRLMHLQARYLPSHHNLKGMKVTITSKMKNVWDSLFGGLKIKIDHKGQIINIPTKSKLEVSGKKGGKLLGEIQSKMKWKVSKHNINLNLKGKSIGEGSVNLGGNFKLNEQTKLNCNIFFDYKKAQFNYRASIGGRTSGKYNDWRTFKEREWMCGGSLGIGITKGQIWLKNQCELGGGHRGYMQNKISYEKGKKIENLCYFSLQDQEAIGTLNAEFKFDGIKLKSQEYRLVIEYKKLYHIGAQFRNGQYQFVVGHNKIPFKGLRNINFSVNREGLMIKWGGKLFWQKQIADYNIAFAAKYRERNWLGNFSYSFGAKFNF